jgi:CheY-like chemotaxis protein
MASHLPTQILLVEDNDDDAFLFKRSVRRLGDVAVVLRANDANAAVAALSSVPEQELPALVVLDLKLTGLDGLDVLAWIRSQPSLQDLQVVIFSSSDLEKDRSEALKRKASGYVVKPLTARDYDLIISQILSRYLNQERAPH